MKYFTRNVMSLLLLVIAQISFAQTAADYAFSTFTGQTLDPMTGSATLVGASIDDAAAAAVPIGFSFNYCGANYTDFSTSPDGFIRLGTGTAANQFTNAITSTTNIPKLFPYWDDMATGPNGSVTTVLTGTPGSQIRVIEWFTSVPRAFDSDPATARFQLWLYEGTNVIEFRYGNIAAPVTGQSASVGINGPLATNFQSITVSSNTSSNSLANNSIATFPDNGRMYRFTPITPTTVANATVTPSGNSCLPTARLLSIDLTNTTEITNANINWTLNGVAQTPIPLSLATGTGFSGNWTGTIPAPSNAGLQTINYNVFVTLSGGLNAPSPVNSGSYQQNTTGTVASADQTIGITQTATLNASANDPALLVGKLLISEVIHFETGTGATNPYPAYMNVAAYDLDGLEITNISNSSLNVGGLVIKSYTGTLPTTYTYTIPEGTVIPVGGVATFAQNTAAVSSPANLFFAMATTFAPGSSTAAGYTLQTASGVILDAVALTGYTFPVSTGVTATNWSGSIPSASGRAGVLRVAAADGNTAADWAISSATTLQNFGSYNTTLTQVNTPATGFTWAPGGQTTQSITVGPLAVGSYTYTVSYTLAGCTNSDEVVVNVVDCLAPTVNSATNITGTSADITFTNNSTAISNSLEYGPVGFTPGTGTVVNNVTSPYTINGLSPLTNYGVIATINCSGSQTSSSAPFNFTTGCPASLVGNTPSNPIIASTFPYTNSFSNAGWACATDNGARIGTKDIWYRFVADSCASSITVATCGTLPTWDTYINILAADSVTQVAFNDDGCSPLSSATFTPIAGATYYAVVEAFSTTTTTNTFVLTINQTIGTPSSALSTSTVGTSCSTASDGSATVTATSGKSPFTYLWSNGGTTSTITGLANGTYTVTVTNGCNGTSTASVNINTAFTFSAASINVSCNGGNDGTATLTIGGATSPTYAWSNGATSQNLTGLSAGTYVVTITNGACTVNASAVVTEPTTIAVTLDNITNVACNGGTTGAINVSVSGGTPIVNQVTYTLQMFDDFGDGWANDDFGTGFHTLNILANGTPVAGSPFTMLTGTTALPVTFTAPSGALVTCNFNDTGLYQDECEWEITNSNNVVVASMPLLQTGNFTTSFNVPVNQNPYTYLWSNGATTQDLSGLPAGTYTGTITDGNGCTLVAGPLTVTQNPAIGVVVDNTADATCFGAADGEISISVSGGNGTYTFAWSNGATTEDLTGLVSGSYTGTITDGLGCTLVAGPLLIEQPTQITLALDSTTNILCNGNSTGAIAITVAGGSAPYTFAWSNGSTTEDLSNLPAGSYVGTITDDNGCTVASSAIVITEPSDIAVALDTVINVLCNGGATGEIQITVSGGVSPYTYLWSNGATAQDLTGLTVGVYTGTITDANGCVLVAGPVTVSEPTVIVVTPDLVTNVSCFGLTNGKIEITVTGGTSPYTYLWSNGTTSQDLSNIGAGSYSGTITDANGCTLVAGPVVITEPTALSLVVDNTTNVSCNGGSNGAISITVSGGTPGYTYLWSNGSTTDDLTGLGAGSYTGTVTDANGCTLVGGPVVITAPAALSASVATTNEIQGGAAGTTTLTVGGGTSPYTYLWSNGATTQNLSGLLAGTYTVTVTDANGCTITASGVVSFITGLGQIGGISEIKLYPNPTTEVVNVFVSNETASDVKVEIFTAEGRLVVAATESNAKETTVQLNLGAQAAGLYFARITTNEATITRTFTVAK